VLKSSPSEPTTATVKGLDDNDNINDITSLTYAEDEENKTKLFIKDNQSISNISRFKRTS
jgi:hypothetical protein